jgi:hypothetical protein
VPGHCWSAGVIGDASSSQKTRMASSRTDGISRSDGARRSSRAPSDGTSSQPPTSLAGDNKPQPPTVAAAGRINGSRPQTRQGLGFSTCLHPARHLEQGTWMKRFPDVTSRPIRLVDRFRRAPFLGCRHRPRRHAIQMTFEHTLHTIRQPAARAPAIASWLTVKPGCMDSCP